MNCVLFANIDKVFQLKNQNIKKYWKIEKNTGKVEEFCQSGKVGTMNICVKVNSTLRKKCSHKWVFGENSNILVIFISFDLDL